MKNCSQNLLLKLWLNYGFDITFKLSDVLNSRWSYFLRANLTVEPPIIISNLTFNNNIYHIIMYIDYK